MLLQNEAGALGRVAGMFSARGYNIDSLTVAATHEPAVSRLTLVTTGEDAVIDQIVKQSRKLVDVIEIVDLTSRQHLEFELLIVRIAAPRGKSAALESCLREYPRAIAFEKNDASWTIQFTGRGEELDAFLSDVNKTASIIDVARSGTAALDSGAREVSNVAA